MRYEHQQRYYDGMKNMSQRPARIAFHGLAPSACTILIDKALHKPAPALDITKRLLDDADARMGLQLDLPKCRLILANILLQDIQERLSLLRADIDPLKILYGYLI